MHVALFNERSQAPVATLVEIAATRRTRRRGLLGRDRLDEASAMLLAPCTAVHTAGMRFAIDVVFVDRQGYAVKVVRNLRPWRIALATGGRAVIEMAAGSLGWGQVLPGDRLYLAPTSAKVPSEKTAEIAKSAERHSKTVAPARGFVRRLRDTAGTSIVEAAIITPLLLLLTLSVVDFGALFDSSASPTTPARRRTATAPSWRASTTTPRPRPTSARRSRRSRTRFCD